MSRKVRPFRVQYYLINPPKNGPYIFRHLYLDPVAPGTRYASMDGYHGYRSEQARMARRLCAWCAWARCVV